MAGKRGGGGIAREGEREDSMPNHRKAGQMYATLIDTWHLIKISSERCT